MKESDNGKKYNFQKLTPVNNGDIKIYDETLNFVFSENDLRNVAITGPYSAGKSSVLETYKKLNKSKKFIHISLAHFEVVDQKNNQEEDYKESVLEGKILNQLIHQIDSKKIPQTHFKIKRKPSKISMALNTGMIVVFIVILMYLIGFNEWNAYVGSLRKSFVKSLLSWTTNKELLSVAGVLGTGIFSFWIFSLVKIQKEKNILRKISFHGNEIEIFEKR